MAVCTADRSSGKEPLFSSLSFQNLQQGYTLDTPLFAITSVYKAAYNKNTSTGHSQSEVLNFMIICLGYGVRMPALEYVLKKLEQFVHICTMYVYRCQVMSYQQLYTDTW